MSVLPSLTQTRKSIFDKAVGKCPTNTVCMVKTLVPCLIDTGAEVTTITDRYYYDVLLPANPDMVVIDTTRWIKLFAGNGTDMPYIGYCEVDMNIGGIFLPAMSLNCQGTH